ncbi:hypothetical protein AWC38_SpisGene12488 [Stylophora pistillata]|uniref:Uncharacterized protein n=1 Tax=Stylophora pistillata TaxID=50429 RepID=A0A2B4S0P3_STYPI|nr:hypothetical protein AWC38_SpisGene12488 [Stylophora pistillata]
MERENWRTLTLWTELMKVPTHLTTQEPGREDNVVSKVLTLFQQATSICSLEAELILKDHSVRVRTSGGPVQLARCRLILDTEKGKITFKVHKSAALAMAVPGAVTKVVLALNTTLNCLPIQTKSSIIKAFNAIFKVLTAGNSIDDVRNDAMFEDNLIDPEKALSEATFTAPSKLFSTVLTVDVKIICPGNVVVEFKKREMLAALRRQRVVLDAKQSLQIIKEPRSILRGKQVQTAMTALALWVSSSSQFNAWQTTLEVVKCLQKACS